MKLLMNKVQQQPFLRFYYFMFFETSPVLSLIAYFPC